MADKVKDATVYRIKQIEIAEANYYKTLTETLDRIERDVIRLADTDLPRQQGKLIELQSAIAIRPKIKAILDREYLPFADQVVREGFNKQAKRIEKAFKSIGNIPKEFQELSREQTGNDSNHNDVEIYTHVKLDNNRWVWHQEAFDMVIPNTDGKSPKDANPWLVLRFNSVDGENYGRGRVEEFLGDFKSLNALSQAMVEGSASAAKVVFVVSPSSMTKPQTIAQAGNGAIVQGRPEDIGVIQVGKTADFSTALSMIQSLERRLLEAFLVLNVRQSERTTAEEVRLTQLELEQQLGGLFSLLTVEFLVPYLNRKLLVLSRSGQLPKYPKDLVKPTIVAGINALGRGQDRESLTSFITTIAQTLGPEAMMKFINADEAIKRLAAAQGIDVLNLVKSMEDQQAEADAAAQQEQEMMAMQQAPQMMKAPMFDPSKNPDIDTTMAPPE